MDQESTNYLTSDSTFNVPIILSSDGLESFASSSITEEDEAGIQETSHLEGLGMKISEENKFEDSENNTKLETDTNPKQVDSEQVENIVVSNQNLKVR